MVAFVPPSSSRMTGAATDTTVESSRFIRAAPSTAEKPSHDERVERAAGGATGSGRSSVAVIGAPYGTE